MENKYFFVYTLDGIQMNILRNITKAKGKELYWRAFNKSIAGLYGVEGEEQRIREDVLRLFNKGVKRANNKPNNNVAFDARKTATEIMEKFGLQLVVKTMMHGESSKETKYKDYDKYIEACEHASKNAECTFFCGGFRVIEVVFGKSKPYTYLVTKQYKKLGKVVINGSEAKIVSYSIMTPKRLFEIANKFDQSVEDFYKVI